MHLINYPSPYGPETVWIEFLDRMMKLPQDDTTVRWAVETAHRTLARLRDPARKARRAVTDKLKELAKEAPYDEPTKARLLKAWVTALQEIVPLPGDMPTAASSKKEG